MKKIITRTEYEYENPVNIKKENKRRREVERRAKKLWKKAKK
jgi:hypothetical protein